MLWMKDMAPGAGFGILDHRGLPKVAYHHLRRALSPVAVWTTDESVSGIALHVANDRGEPLSARLRLALYHDLHNRVADAEELVEVEPHGHLERTVEGMLGRFVDSALTFGFGPPAHDAIVVSLESVDEPGRLISQAMRFPAGRPLGRDTSAHMGVRVGVEPDADGSAQIAIGCERLLYGAVLDVPGFELGDNAFSVEPGRPRIIRAQPTGPGVSFIGGALKAINMSDTVSIDLPPAERAAAAAAQPVRLALG